MCFSSVIDSPVCIAVDSIRDLRPSCPDRPLWACRSCSCHHPANLHLSAKTTKKTIIAEKTRAGEEEVRRCQCHIYFAQAACCIVYGLPGDRCRSTKHDTAEAQYRGQFVSKWWYREGSLVDNKSSTLVSSLSSLIGYCTHWLQTAGMMHKLSPGVLAWSKLSFIWFTGTKELAYWYKITITDMHFVPALRMAWIAFVLLIYYSG
jgi:hypothetical protein